MIRASRSKERPVAGSNARAEERIAARMRVRGRGPEIEAQVLDASSRGMLLAAANPPQHGEIVELAVGGQVLVGQVRWARGNQFGVKLGDRIDARAVAAGRGVPVLSRPVTTAAAAESEPVEETGLAYNFVFFAAAAVASVGFLLTALNRSVG
jgi:PilZ domain